LIKCIQGTIHQSCLLFFPNFMYYRRCVQLGIECHILSRKCALHLFIWIQLNGLVNCPQPQPMSLCRLACFTLFKAFWYLIIKKIWNFFDVKNIFLDLWYYALGVQCTKTALYFSKIWMLEKECASGTQFKQKMCCSSVLLNVPQWVSELPATTTNEPFRLACFSLMRTFWHLIINKVWIFFTSRIYSWTFDIMHLLYNAPKLPLSFVY